MKLKISLVVLAATTMLASCVSSGPERRPMPVSVAPEAPPPSNGVDGNWTDPNGLVSSFTNGQFVTRTTDGTNTQLASGTYTRSPDNTIQINLYSNVKKTTSLVNCALVGPRQLNCTSDAGARFSLTRQM